ncbi:MAG: lytic murein transglycosylase B [Burkholderiales bacterium]
MTFSRRTFLAALGAVTAPAGAYEFPAGMRGDMAVFAERATQKHGFAEGWVESVLREATVQPAVIRAVSSPGTARPWRAFRPVYLNRQRIDGGVRFWRDNAGTLERAATEFGVPPEVMVSIIGVETIYGKQTGTFRVLDALVTLSFEVSSRAAYFQSELEELLLLARDGVLDPSAARGSYAGAMGMPQFMPSSLRRYARDFDGDARIDLWRSAPDAIASVGNYLRTFGWRTGEDVVLRTGVADRERVTEFVNRGAKPSLVRADLDGAAAFTERPLRQGETAALFLFEGESGAEYWAGLDNFYAITRYNRSQNYALAVWQLARAIVEARG